MKYKNQHKQGLTGHRSKVIVNKERARHANDKQAKIEKIIQPLNRQTTILDYVKLACILKIAKGKE